MDPRAGDMAAPPREISKKKYSREALRFVDDSGEGGDVEAAGRGVAKKKYSRAELEELRFVDSEWQWKRWSEVFRVLGSPIEKEYAGLRHQERRGQGKGKKKETHSISFSDACVRSVACGSDELDESDIAYGGNLVDSSSSLVEEELFSEEEYDDDDSESEYSIQRPAFLVDGEPDFESGSPQDGFEFLRRVRWEAAQIPKIKVAKLDSSKHSSEQTPYMPHMPDIAKCPTNLLPSKDWENAFLADFSEIRQAFSEYESSCNQPYNSETTESCYKRAGCKHRPKGVPTLTAVLDMDTVSRAATLENLISVLGTASSLSKNDCQWLFALCVTVDIPLHAETGASLRCLLRKCMSLLAEKSEPDDEVVMLNMLATVAGKYFGQSEK